MQTRRPRVGGAVGGVPPGPDGRFRALPGDVWAVRRRGLARRGLRVRTAGRRRRLQRPLRFQAATTPAGCTTYTLARRAARALGEAGAIAELGGPVSPDNADPVAQARRRHADGGRGRRAVGGSLSRVGARGFPSPPGCPDRAWFRRATALLAPRAPWGFALGMLMGLLPCAPLLPSRSRRWRRAPRWTVR